MPILIGKRLVQTFKEAGLGLPFARLVSERQEFKAMIDEGTTALGDKKKDDPNQPGMNARIESLMEAKGLDAVVVDSWLVTRSSGKSVTIPREKLVQTMLEAGIESDTIETIVEAATNESEYTYIQVTRAKELEERAAAQGFEPVAAKAKLKSKSKLKLLVAPLRASIADAKKKKRRA